MPTLSEFVAALPPGTRWRQTYASRGAAAEAVAHGVTRDLAWELDLEPDDIDVHRFDAADCAEGSPERADLLARNAVAFVGVPKAGRDLALPRPLVARLLSLLPAEHEPSPSAFDPEATVLWFRPATGPAFTISCHPTHGPWHPRAHAELVWADELHRAAADLRRATGGR